MKLFVILLGMVSWISAESNSESNSGSYRCPNVNNPDADLVFVDPKGYEDPEDPYPSNSLQLIEGSYFSFSCCATGYNKIRWYIDDVQIKPNSTRVQIVDQGQMLQWTNIKSDSPVVDIRCEVIKDNAVSISHTYNLSIKPVCKEVEPYYTTLPKTQCASPGDDVYVECGVQHADISCTIDFFNTIIFEDSEGVMIDAYSQYMDNVEVTIEKLTSRLVTGSMLFRNITQEQINMQFYCMPFKFRYKKAGFGFKSDCSKIEQDETEKTLIGFQPISNQVDLTAVVIIVVAVVASVTIFCCLMVIYRQSIFALLSRSDEKPTLDNQKPDEKLSDEVPIC